jgi:large subunit ribosomal protein L25
MAEIRLKAKLREEIGKEAVKKIRHQDLVPAVVYKGNKSQNIKVNSRELWEVLHTKAGENVIISLEVEGAAKSKKARPTIIKEIQYHPIKGNVLHLDLQEISLTEVIEVKVPVAVKGEALGVKEGGVLEHILWEVEVECLPTQIPESIPIDVSALNIGDTIALKDLNVPPEVKLLGDPEAAVIHVAAPHVEEVEEAPVEGEEAQEPEVIMEKKPKEEEEVAEEPAKEKAQDKDKGKKP